MIGSTNIRWSILEEEGIMFAVLNRLLCTPDGRQTVADLMYGAATSMEQCLHYSIVLDSTDAKAIWVYEVWPSEEAHVASLRLPAVGEAIQKARPSIESAERVFSGHDLKVARDCLSSA
ncbi:putative quinol monooxygenase [Qipengyuania sp. ASV99]|uniref:putative quinol monooxygenase n=1 Tax=Qipengyuania sp. ASV99 TaxID=3399681 RepID=UPI003A4C81A6